MPGTVFVTDPTHTDHVAPRHPERPARLEAIVAQLEERGLHGRLLERPPRDATDEELRTVHDTALLAAVERAAARGASLDADTYTTPQSLGIARRSAGALLVALEAVLAGEATNGFVATRPPGHHALPGRAMGFCLFNNVAIAATAALNAGVQRLAIVDWDVHHGNGTQDIFWRDKSVCFASTHQMPLYPGTGALGETGEGNIWNAPLRPGDGGEQFRQAMESRVLPALRNFAPDLILISAGFDAHEADPLANLRLVEADFAWATTALLEIAARHARGRVVSVLEGGYDLTALARSVAVHVKGLMDA